MSHAYYLAHREQLKENWRQRYAANREFYKQSYREYYKAIRNTPKYDRALERARKRLTERQREAA